MWYSKPALLLDLFMIPSTQTLLLLTLQELKPLQEAAPTGISASGASAKYFLQNVNMAGTAVYDTPAVEQRERREAGRRVERRRAAAAAHARRVAQAPAVEAGRGPRGDGRVHAVLLAQQAHRGATL
jgi:hypothetical protein